MAGNQLSGNGVPTSGIPLKDVGLFQRYAGSAHVAVPLAEQMHEILEATRGR
jgi:3-hydroxyisobutyrate dehydrogenase-like beta-hydroxyacid dehydrogenase